MALQLSRSGRTTSCGSFAQTTADNSLDVARSLHLRHLSFEQFNMSPIRFAFALLMTTLATGALAQPAPPPTPPPLGAPELSGQEGQPQSGYIWNLTDRPLRYQLRRSSGLSWTRFYELPPGQRTEYHAGAMSYLLGLGPNTQPRYVIVRFEALGGFIQQRLSARSIANPDVLMPFYFLIEDSSGERRLIQAPSRERALELQARLREDPRPTPAQLAAYQAQLRISGVFRDELPETYIAPYLVSPVPGPGQLSPGLPPWACFPGCVAEPAAP